MIGKLLKNKIVLNIIILLFLTITVYIMYKSYKKNKAKEKVKEKQEEVKAENQANLNNILNSHIPDIGGDVVGEAKTYTKHEYKLMAHSMYIAMVNMQTDEETIFNILSALRTKADWTHLVAAFGIREGSWFSSFKGGLIVWLQDELNSSEKARVNSLLNKFHVNI